MKCMLLDESECNKLQKVQIQPWIVKHFPYETTQYNLRASRHK